MRPAPPARGCAGSSAAILRAHIRVNLVDALRDDAEVNGVEPLDQLLQRMP